MSTTTQTVDQTEYVTTDTVGLLGKLAAVRTDMNAALVERSEVIDVLLVALVAEQHAVLLGDPGTAKSTAINALASRIGGGVGVFKQLMDKYTDVGQILGPQSIPGLMAEQFRRKLSYGATASIWFLDEIWKSSNAVLNALLTALEERAVDNDGVRVDMPLLSCYAASNEPPADDSLRALRDRFALCIYVEYVSDRGYIELSRRKARGQKPTVAASLTLDELRALHALRRTVHIGDSIIQLMAQARRRLREEVVIVSDRRLLVAYDTLAAHALLSGRTEVREADFAILKHVLWSDEKDRDAVKRVIAELNSREQRAHTVVRQARDAHELAMRNHAAADSDGQMTIALKLLRELKRAQGDLLELLTDARAEGESLVVIGECRDDIAKLIAKVQAMV